MPRRPKTAKEPKPPAPLESATQKKIVAYLVANRFLTWRSNQGAMQIEGRFVRFSSMKGISDLQALRDGQSVFIEVKQEGKSASKNQRTFLGAAKRYGAIAFVARSVQDVFDELKDYFPDLKPPMVGEKTTIIAPESTKP